MDEPVQPGEILAQKYRVDKVLGVGGMGVVVAATHISLEQRVALKFMLAEGFRSPDALSRFHREARIAVKLRSEHVARVTDTGTLENGAPYIVMEYLEGSDLAGQLTQHGPMPVGFAAECIVQACDAVGEAHSHGVVHRDLKPANLFLTQHADGSPLIKVLDFGISKAALGAEEGMAMTKTGAIMGSPLYMSPEQLRSLKTVDARTDVWALGVVLYELLSGTTPFNAESFGDLLLQVMTTPHKPLVSIVPNMPPQVSALVDACLAKDPDHRVQSVAQLAEALAPFCSATGVVIAQRIVSLARKSGTTGDPRVITGMNAIAAANTGVGWAGTGPEPGTSRKPWALLGAGVGLLAAVGIGVFAFSARSAKEPIVASPALASAAPPAPATPDTATAAPPPTAASPAAPEPEVASAAASAAPSSTPEGRASKQPPHTKAPVAVAQPSPPPHPAAAVHAPAAPHPAAPASPGGGILDTSN